MKIIVAGSRTINDYELVKKVILESGWIDENTEIVSGMAKGVDMLGVEFAKSRGIRVHMFPANWNKYGRSAGMFRNREMANFADALIAIWDGKSRGTRSMIDIARLRGMKILVHRIVERIK